MRRKETPFAITLSVIALVLSAYAIFTVTEFKKGGTAPGGDLKTDVYDIIDDYVAEKSGAAAQPPSGEPIEVSLDDDAMKGDIDAPVTIVEFSDYECPFCGRFFNETLPQIRENYIDKGIVRHVFRDFPLNFHPNAIPAANAAECIREQGGDEIYWAYHDILFENQTALSVADLKTYASEFDIDQGRFDACVDEEKYKAEVAEDFADGQKYGVRGTPGFFINGVPLSGAQPYAAFEAAIEAALGN